jgi:tetratricopeptide (TPR) repeat protein
MAGYRACIAVEPGRVEPRSNLGAVLAGLGRYAEAIHEYRQALKVAPPEFSPRLRFNLALAYYKSSQIPEAAAELEPLVAQLPGDHNLLLLLADCRLRTGEFQKAIDVLNPLAAAEPGDPAVDYILGMALIRGGKPADGQRLVDRILGRGESAEGHFLLGSAIFERGDYPSSLAEFAKAAALNPDVPSLQSYYGRALLFTGDPDGAVAAFRKELAANPNDFDANFQYASILARRGNLQESRKLLLRAVSARPTSPEAREALDHGFRFEKPGGDPGVPAGTLAPAVGAFRPGSLGKPVVLVFGSYTCPKLRTSAGELKRIYARYRGRVEFRLVYIREAHAGSGPEAQWQSTINRKEGIDLSPARNLEEKQAHAQLCVRKLTLTFPALVDGIDGAAEAAYRAWPSRAYLIDATGRVVWNSRLGELDFHPGELEAAIGRILAKGASDAVSR